jgi:hypothetical protein
MSGERNPYPGDLRVVRPGALADLLLVRGNPLEDLDLLASPVTNLSLIMKDGRIHKNNLGPRTLSPTMTARMRDAQLAAM